MTCPNCQQAESSLAAAMETIRGQPEREEQKFAAMKAKIGELVSHNEKIYEALREMKEADIRHARTCPMHVKNIDSWVRESDLLKAKEELSASREREARMREYIDALETLADQEIAHKDSLRFQAVKRMRAALSQPGGREEKP